MLRRLAPVVATCLLSLRDSSPLPTAVPHGAARPWTPTAWTTVGVDPASRRPVLRGVLAGGVAAPAALQSLDRGRFGPETASASGADRACQAAFSADPNSIISPATESTRCGVRSQGVCVQTTGHNRAASPTSFGRWAGNGLRAGIGATPLGTARKARSAAGSRGAAGRLTTSACAPTRRAGEVSGVLGRPAPCRLGRGRRHRGDAGTAFSAEATLAAA